MSVVLTTFGGVALPGYNWSAELGTPRTQNPVIPTLGGLFDIYGVRRRIEHSQIFDIQGLIDSATLASAIRTLKGQVGRVGTLVRTDRDGTNSLQRTCRLLSVGHPVRADQRGYINMLALTFFSNEPFWRSSSTTTHTSSAMSAGSNTFNFTVGGEEDVLDAVITFTASANTSSLTINHSKTENSVNIVSNLVFSSTINNTKVFRLDCGQYTVTNDGANAYSGLAEGATHTENYWMRLPPGSNSFTVTVGGTGAGTMAVAYQAQYQ
ncbi:MAG: hypothetical protein E6Q97_15965 [Desulfurellales bacterium]|nr:MAG: hypothetical protein E6Q97_15965 [Desulfurellales bacterium]